MLILKGFFFLLIITKILKSKEDQEDYEDVLLSEDPQPQQYQVKSARGRTRKEII